MHLKFSEEESIENFVEKIKSATSSEFLFMDLTRDKCPKENKSFQTIFENNCFIIPEKETISDERKLSVLFETLKEIEQPFSLDLAGFGLLDPFIFTLEPLLLCQRAKLKALNLSGNPLLSSNFFKKLAQAILANNSVLILNFSQTAAATESKLLVVNSIIGKARFDEIHLGPIGDFGVGYLTHRLKDLPFLRKISFSEGQFIRRF